MIWKIQPPIELINKRSENTLVSHLGIQFTEVGDDYMIGSMPVVDHNKQPFGLLHGGASVVLAETLGSVASQFVIGDDPNKTPVGLEINANHLKSARSGHVYGTVTAIKLGRTTHIWQIKIRDDQDQLICISRLTCMIIDKNRVKT